MWFANHTHVLLQVVIGGDGSLTGAERFKTEWPDLLAALVEAGKCFITCTISVPCTTDPYAQGCDLS